MLKLKIFLSILLFSQFILANSELFDAIEKEDAQKVESLLEEEGLDPNEKQRERGGMTPLFKATAKGNVEIVRILLSHGADPNIQNGNKGLAALHLAVLDRNKELAKILIENGANPNIEIYRGGFSPIYFANQKKYFDIVNILNGWY